RRVRRADHLRPDPAGPAPRARSEVHPHHRGTDRDAAPRGPAGRPRVDHLSRHHARGAADPFRTDGRVCGKDFFLAFSPEREDPGNERFNTRTIPKVVGGIDAPSRRAAEALCGSIIDTVVPVSSTEVAESSKLLENIFRAVNIALVNEMKVVFERMGIDVW